MEEKGEVRRMYCPIERKGKVEIMVRMNVGSIYLLVNNEFLLGSNEIG